MKILYHHRIASKDGQYVHISEIVRALENEGHIVTVVVPETTESSEFGHDGGFVTKLKEKLPLFVYELMEFGYNAIVAIKLFRAIKSFNPDIIYERYNLHQPVGVFISKKMKVPLILEVNAPLKEEREAFGKGLAMPRFAKAVENYTWKNADAVLPVSCVLADNLIKSGVEEGKVTVIHNGIRESVIEKNKNKSTNPPETLVVGFVGFMHLTCGVDMAIEAISEIKNKIPEMSISLVCVGDGLVISDLKNKAKKYGVESQVIFPGLVSRDRVMDYVSTFDISILPDVTAYASPLKIFEYMAEKTAIVAPDCDNIKEIFNLPEEGSVSYFQKGNKEQFKASLKSLLLSPDLLSKQKNASFETLVKNKYTWESNARRIAKIGEQLVKAKSK